MWDTWLYYHEGIHYLYYLHKSTGKTWDGMSVASSTDGVHYEEIGPIIHKRDDAAWLGTGSVWRAGDKFILNFSEMRAGIQAIFFAQSDDLIHWERLGDELRSDPDPRWYDNTNTGRWDCIWGIEKPEGGGFWGYLTACPWDKTPGVRFDSVGMVESEDGIHWHAVEPPVIDWGEWPQMSVGPEVGAIERIGDRYYLMRCYREYGLGGRQVGWDPWQKLAWTLSTLE